MGSTGRGSRVTPRPPVPPHWPGGRPPLCLPLLGVEAEPPRAGTRGAAHRPAGVSGILAGGAGLAQPLTDDGRGQAPASRGPQFPHLGTGGDDPCPAPSLGRLSGTTGRKGPCSLGNEGRVGALARGGPRPQPLVVHQVTQPRPEAGVKGGAGAHWWSRRQGPCHQPRCPAWETPPQTPS